MFFLKLSLSSQALTAGQSTEETERFTLPVLCDDRVERVTAGVILQFRDSHGRRRGGLYACIRNGTREPGDKVDLGRLSAQGSSTRANLTVNLARLRTACKRTPILLQSLCDDSPMTIPTDFQSSAAWPWIACFVTSCTTEISHSSRVTRRLGHGHPAG